MVSLRFSPCQGVQKQAARVRSTAESRMMNTSSSLVEQSMQAAQSNKGPVEVHLNNDFWLSACPETDCIMLSVGPHQASRTNMVSLLQRRAEQPQKFGPWLPAMLKDERLVVLRKVPKSSSGVDPFPDDWLKPALELLS
jgi:hypothetical protein